MRKMLSIFRVQDKENDVKNGITREAHKTSYIYQIDKHKT